MYGRMDVHILSVLLLAAFGSIKDVIAEVTSCPTCLHLNVSMEGVPSEVSNQVSAILQSMSNPDCLQGGASVNIKCSPSMLTTTKCQTATVNAKAVGMKGLYPEAVMNQLVVVRTCAERPLSEPDRCIDIKELDAQQRGKLLSSLDNVRQQWESIDVTGKTCFRSSGGAYTATSGSNVYEGGKPKPEKPEAGVVVNPTEPSGQNNQQVKDPTGTASRLYATSYLILTLLGAAMAALMRL